MQNSLPARPSLEQLKKQAKELVKAHRATSPEVFAKIREHLPSLSNKSDEAILLYPFSLHDAHSVVARKYGFSSWNQLRNKIEAGADRGCPDSSVEQKFKTICRSKELGDYNLYSSVMNEAMLQAVPEERFMATNLAPYFTAKYTTTYFGEMAQGEHVVYFWRISAPGIANDVLARMAVKDDLVSGMLFSGAFEAPRK